MRKSLICAISSLLLVNTIGVCRADQDLLSPSATTSYPNQLKLTAIGAPWHHGDSYAWLQYASPQGIEFQLERTKLFPDRPARYGLNVAYPLLIDIGSIPALTVGIRDALGTGIDHMALYAAVGKETPLSESQSKWIRSFTLTAGVGTGNLEGLFISMRLRLRSGLQLFGEEYRYRPDVGFEFPLERQVSAKVASLNGRLFFGAEIRILNN